METTYSYSKWMKLKLHLYGCYSSFNVQVCVAKGPPADAIGSLIETYSGKQFDGVTCDAALTLQNKSFILLTVEQILSTETLAI
jgi:hypothetical protein